MKLLFYSFESPAVDEVTTFHTFICWMARGRCSTLVHHSLVSFLGLECGLGGHGKGLWWSLMGHILPAGQTLTRRLPVCSWRWLPSKGKKPSQGRSPGITSKEHLPGLAVALCWKSFVCMGNGTRSADDSQHLAGPHQPWPLWQVGGQASVYLGQSSQGLFLMEMEINSRVLPSHISQCALVGYIACQDLTH